MDGVWKSGGTERGVEIVVHNSNGHFVAGRTIHYDHVFPALWVAAMASRLDAALVVEKGLSYAVFKVILFKSSQLLRVPSLICPLLVLR
ncbi:unnamed protein product [Prunus armeniaca]